MSQIRPYCDLINTKSIIYCILIYIDCIYEGSERRENQDRGSEMIAQDSDIQFSLCIAYLAKKSLEVHSIVE